MADPTRTVAPARPRPERRKNVDRSAAPRRQILEAQIKCLDQWGYGAVTNIKVADAAGMSRGAMMHHFPTRQALIVATVESAWASQSVFRAADLAKVQSGLNRFRRVTDLSFATQRMPEGMALNEIRIGSRSDPESRDAHDEHDLGRLCPDDHRSGEGSRTKTRPGIAGPDRDCGDGDPSAGDQHLHLSWQ
jgi:AcrR family transcriptional regulator